MLRKLSSWYYWSTKVTNVSRAPWGCSVTNILWDSRSCYSLMTSGFRGLRMAMEEDDHSGPIEDLFFCHSVQNWYLLFLFFSFPSLLLFFFSFLLLHTNTYTAYICKHATVLKFTGKWVQSNWYIILNQNQTKCKILSHVFLSVDLKF